MLRPRGGWRGSEGWSIWTLTSEPTILLEVIKMAEKPQKGKGGAEEKAPKEKEKPDLIRDLWRAKARLKLHLSDGTVVEGQIKQFDLYNLQVEADTGRRYWVPKHAVVYAEML